jgi:hypothetical protein
MNGVFQKDCGVSSLSPAARTCRRGIVYVLAGLLVAPISLLLVTHLGIPAVPWTLLCLVCLAIFIKEFKGDWFEPIIASNTFFMVFFVIVPVFILTDDAFLMPHIEDTDWLAGKAFLCAALALTFLYAGYKSRLGTTVGCRLPLQPLGWRRKKAVAAIVVFVCVSIVCYFLLLQLNGGFVRFVSHIGNRARLFQGKGPVCEPIKLLNLALLASYILVIRKPTRLGKFLLLCLTAVCVVILTTLGSFSNLLGPLISLLFVHNYLVKRLKLRVMLSIFVGLFLFLHIGLQVRELMYVYASSGSMTKVVEMARSRDQKLSHRMAISYGTVDVAMALMERISKHGDLRWGSTYLSGLLGLVPRAWYPDKPWGSAAEVHYIIHGQKFYHTQNLDAPQSASAITRYDEMYLNFSYPGVMIGAFLWGVLLRVFYTFLTQNAGSNMAVLVGAYCFLFLVSLGCDFSQFLIGFVPSFLALIVLHKYVKPRKSGVAALHAVIRPAPGLVYGE